MAEDVRGVIAAIANKASDVPLYTTLLNLLLTAGVASVLANAVVAQLRAAADRKRELHGLLRMLLVEIKSNNHTMETLMGEDARVLSNAEGFEDEAWKEGRTRLAQLLPNENHFHHLNLYYRNNANVEGLAFQLVRLGLDIGQPKSFPEEVTRKMLEQQLEMGRTALKIVREYVSDDDPYCFHSQECTDEQIRSIERELKERRGEENGDEF